MPLSGHAFHAKSDDELRYIIKDAGEAAQAMRDHDPVAEGKYLDQVNDACTILRYRQELAPCEATGLAYSQQTRDWTEKVTYKARNREEARNWVYFNRDWMKDLRIDGRPA